MDITRREARMPITINQVIDAWNLTSEVSHGSPGGASPEAITEAERILGHALPPSTRELYLAFDGGDFIGGNINLLPLLPRFEGDLALTTASDLMREWMWPVPPEMLVMGGNGSEEHYGLWLHDDSETNPIIVEIGEDDAENALAVVGDDLAGFLAGHSAYYLLMFASDGYDLGPALDAIGLPREIRGTYSIANDDEYYRLLNWANPHLPDKKPDPYGPGVTREQINEFVRSRP
jgi:hypothetical protein